MYHYYYLYSTRANIYFIIPLKIISNKKVTLNTIEVFNKNKYFIKKTFLSHFIFSLFISLIQMFFGTQVRGNVEQDISNVLASFELFFHRLLVPVILLVNIFLVFGLNFLQRKIYNPKVGFEKISLILILVSLIASGSYVFI